MQALTREDLATVIVHELGHLSGAHGKIGTWIFRTRMMAERILGAVEGEDDAGAWIFQAFYRWYEPKLAAASCALARQQEYQADRMSASVVSPRAAVNALVRGAIAKAFVGEVFWREVWERPDREPRPPEQVYDRLYEALGRLSEWDGARASFESALVETTDETDTHPSLADRARALGAEPIMPGPARDSAATLLADGGAALRAAFSRQWQVSVADDWDARHIEAVEQRRVLAELDDAATHAPLADEDAMTRGYLAERFLGPEAALARFEDALAWSDGTEDLLYAKGRVLFDLGRPEGLAHLDRVMAADDDALIPGCGLAEAYLAAAGRTAEAETYRARRQAHENVLQADWADRNQIWPDDSFVPHHRGLDEVDNIGRAIAGFRKKDLRKAWLVRKPTGYRSWSAAYFLVCEVDWLTRWTGDVDALQAALSERLAGHDDLGVVICEVGEGWLRDKAMFVADARIYPRRA